MRARSVRAGADRHLHPRPVRRRAAGREILHPVTSRGYELGLVRRHGPNDRANQSGGGNEHDHQHAGVRGQSKGTGMQPALGVAERAERGRHGRGGNRLHKLACRLRQERRVAHGGEGSRRAHEGQNRSTVEQRTAVSYGRVSQTERQQNLARLPVVLDRRVAGLWHFPDDDRGRRRPA